MEIWIIGIVVVALMVYASTRIKKSAAAAFEREEIETDEYRLTKPAGYIHPFREESAFAFEAYTKEFGDEESKNFRRSRATLKIISDADFETACKEAKKTADKITSKRFVEDTSAQQKIFYLETEKIESGVELSTMWKIVESRARRRIYQFQASVLKEYEADWTEAARELVNSFEVK